MEAQRAGIPHFRAICNIYSSRVVCSTLGVLAYHSIPIPSDCGTPIAVVIRDENYNPSARNVVRAQA